MLNPWPVLLFVRFFRNDTNPVITFCKSGIYVHYISVHVFKCIPVVYCRKIIGILLTFEDRSSRDNAFFRQLYFHKHAGSTMHPSPISGLKTSVFIPMKQLFPIATGLCIRTWCARNTLSPI